MLNQRQENYAQLLYKGLKQIDAYKEAGFSANSTPVTIANNASRLANSDKIKARLKELNTPIIEEIQSKKQEKLNCLEEIYNTKTPSGLITPPDKIRAIAEHNKMDGVYTESPPIDNRTINIIVSSEKAKELTENISKRLEDAAKQEEG